MKIKNIFLFPLSLITLCLIGIFIIHLPYTQKDSPDQNMEIYSLSAKGDAGILLYHLGAAEEKFILPLLQRSNLKIVVQKEGEVTTGLEYLQQELESQNNIIISSGSKVVDSFPCNIPGPLSPLGVVMISPEADIEYLINEGIYSCSYQTIASTLVLESVTANDAEIANAVSLYNLLSGDTILSNGGPIKAMKGNVSLGIISGAVISDIPYSIDFATALSSFIATQTSVPSPSLLYLQLSNGLTVGLMFFLFLFFIFSVKISEKHLQSSGWQIVTSSVDKPLKFYFSRGVILFSAVLGGILLWLLLCWINGRFFSLVGLSVAYFWAIGIAIPVLYKMQLIPGVHGIPQFVRQPLSIQAIGKLILLALLLLASGSALYASGILNFTFDFTRWFWLMLSIALSTLPFLGISYEMSVMGGFSKRIWMRYLLMLIPYLPLLIPIFMAVPMGQIPTAFVLLRLVGVFVLSGCFARIAENLTSSPYIGSLLGGLTVGLYLFGNIMM